MPQAISIDNYIDAHFGDQNIEIVGKLAIARCIAEAERVSHLKIDTDRANTINFAGIENTWLSAFFKMATEACRRDQIDRIFSNVKFLVFNYDRCIEHFLSEAIVNYFRCEKDDAYNIVRELSILHPYGQIGHLPWQNEGEAFPFGGRRESDGETLLRISKELRTFTEKTEDTPALARLRSAVQEAETIVFLGFGFHAQNLELIAPGGPAQTSRILGTSMGLSGPDTASICGELPSWIGAKPQHLNVDLLHGTCSDLLRDYGRHIMSR